MTAENYYVAVEYNGRDHRFHGAKTYLIEKLEFKDSEPVNDHIVWSLCQKAAKKILANSVVLEKHYPILKDFAEDIHIQSICKL